VHTRVAAKPGRRKPIAKKAEPVVVEDSGDANLATPAPHAEPVRPPRDKTLHELNIEAGYITPRPAIVERVGQRELTLNELNKQQREQSRR
jgi:hypothetical protein